MITDHSLAMSPRTPITLVTGPLGSGKTTLLRHILATRPAKIAIVMNEFGEIAIDTKVIKGKNVRIAELGGGCVCCSLLGEFEAAVNEIITRVAPEIIVVETTGLAEPEALVFNIQEALPQCRLDGVVSVIDADMLVRFPELGHTTRLQIEGADILLLNKIDLIEQTGAASSGSKRNCAKLIRPQRLFGPSAAGSTPSCCSASVAEKQSSRPDRDHRSRLQRTNIGPNSNRSHSRPTKVFLAIALNSSRTACRRAFIGRKALSASRTLRSFSTSLPDAGIWSRSRQIAPNWSLLGKESFRKKRRSRYFKKMRSLTNTSFRAESRNPAM